MTTTLPVPPAPRPVPTPSGHRRRPRRTRWLIALVAALLVWPSVSYVQALTYPGDASFTMRTVEWIRDHNGSGLINTLENWWYGQGPTAAAPDPAALPTGGGAGGAGAPAPIPALSGLGTLPGEGTWTAAAPAPDGTPTVYTTFIRPDPAHPSVVAGLARIDQTHTRVQLLPGTREPVTMRRPDLAQVPQGLRPTLVATFNSGFKMKDAHGGYVLDGRTLVGLRDGAASLVIRVDGTATVGQWGRDVGPGPDVVSVRQNLALIVDGGQPVPGLANNADGSWGSARNQYQYTWRSAVGVDAAGNLIYVAGKDLTLATVADALRQAGAVTGMELDIHDGMVDMFTYRHAGASLTATKLLPTMPRSVDRYLVPDQRDFVAVTLR